MFESPALDPFPRVPAAGGCTPRLEGFHDGLFIRQTRLTQSEEAGPPTSASEKSHISANGAAGAHEKLWTLWHRGLLDGPWRPQGHKASLQGAHTPASDQVRPPPGLLPSHNMAPKDSLVS